MTSCLKSWSLDFPAVMDWELKETLPPKLYFVTTKEMELEHRRYAGNAVLSFECGMSTLHQKNK